MILPFPLSRSDQQMQRVCNAVEQHRNAPFRSADWLAGELMTICETAPANDATPPASDAAVPAGEEMATVELIALLRREGAHSGVWFAPRLLDAADRLEADAAPKVASDTGAGWIVGNNVGQWRTFDSFGWAWTDRRDLAVRYARREDAELVHGDDEDSWRVERYPATPTDATDGATGGGEVRK